ncbi:hypothetical protein [Rathayibacter toxicus]|uniref:hypothetical protein n=1 Tax=Rathayibacter toxicus TaxID=145458 RepID=UPI001C0531DD|nr:hypothetical protein [Rathayibacter toxicus]QWL29369.1 AraC family transcriptional regulator [Rathayibacter toxicus]
MPRGIDPREQLAANPMTKALTSTTPQRQISRSWWGGPATGAPDPPGEPVRPFDDWKPEPSEPAIHLAGQAAANWMSTFGWRPETPFSALQIAGDIVRDHDFLLARITHNARRVERHRAENGIAIILVHDGTLSIRGEGIDTTLQREDTLVHRTPATFTLESELPQSAVEIMIGASRLSRFWTGVTKRPGVVNAEFVLTRLLLVSAISVLEMHVDPTSPSWPSIRESVETLVGAVVAEAGPPVPPSTPSDTVTLIRHAFEFIGLQRENPDFTERSLAEELAVSLDALQTAFTYTGRTPVQTIRAARTASARVMLARRTTCTWLDLGTIARFSGFTSPDELDEALDDERKR